MRHLISEKKVGFAFLCFAIGVILISKATLFADPVVISEKGLLFSIPGIGFILSSVIVGVRSIRKV